MFYILYNFHNITILQSVPLILEGLPGSLLESQGIPQALFLQMNLKEKGCEKKKRERKMRKRESKTEQIPKGNTKVWGKTK